MAGGQGERLQPLTGPRRLKPLLPVRGGGTLLTATIRRARTLVPMARIWIVTTARCERQIRRALPAAMRSRLIVEPQIRGTATCVALIARLVAAQHAAAGMVILPADHWIRPLSGFRSTLRAAMRQSERARHALTCIGIRPTAPHPGYGYLRAQGARVTRFIEKPSRERAAAWIRRRSVYWNSGMFIGSVDAFQTALRRWLPSLMRSIEVLPQPQGRTFRRTVAHLYRRLPVRSFDRSVLERHDDVRLVHARYAWSDVGSWEAWPMLLRILDIKRL